jgi:hypothetical protein
MPRFVALLLALGLGCGAPDTSERERVLGPFLAAHWTIPAAPQGPAPDPVSADPRPEACGACHPEQLADWRTSIHASAASPGLLGQLVEGALAHPAQQRMCVSCHAPLDEQHAFDASLRPNPRFDSRLLSDGVLCAGCHVRKRRFFGPPPRPEAPAVAEPRPHGGFEVREEYRQSRFCAECHQFFDDAGVNGKPIENTFAEWQASPQAAAGRQCQDCHMPYRRHLWRGIHDAEMVRAAVDVDLAAHDLLGETLRAALVVRNRDVGHAFPTYVTPRVFVALFQSDADGNELDGTRVEAVIAREVDLANGVERFDTRVMPGESVKLEYVQARVEGADSLVGRVTVDPDFHYRGVFQSLLPTLSDASARAQIAEASRRISNSSYVLAEIRRPLR